MKNCPYCAEEIQDEAIICKHCHSRLDRKAAAGILAPPGAGGIADYMNYIRAEIKIVVLNGIVKIAVLSEYKKSPPVDNKYIPCDNNSREYFIYCALFIKIYPVSPQGIIIILNYLNYNIINLTKQYLSIIIL